MSAPAVRASTYNANWPGLLALLMALVGVLTFIVFMSVSGQVPKALAYRPNLLFELYMSSPLISGLAGASSAVIAILALRRGSGPVWAAVVGAIVGIAVFNVVMVVVAHIMLAAAPVSVDGQGFDVPKFPSFVFTPPAAAMGTLVIGTSAALARLRGAAGHQPAIASLIMGGAVAFYWLLNLVWSVNAE